MGILKIFILIFICLESANVIALYFFPDSKLANSVGVFTAWTKSKADAETHAFVQYLVNWVAGTKLIFLLLLIVILFTADEQTLILTATALSAAISTFFWRLFPLIRKMDHNDQVRPKNYSKVLAVMIAIFILMFVIAILITR